MLSTDPFCESRMRETLTYGSTRREEIGLWPRFPSYFTAVRDGCDLEHRTHGNNRPCVRHPEQSVFTVKRRTIANRLRRKLREIKQQLPTAPAPAGGANGRVAQVGRARATSCTMRCLDSLWTFRTRLTRLRRTQLLHRSQQRRCNWQRMGRLAGRWLPAPRVLHPWPTQHFVASYPR